MNEDLLLYDKEFFDPSIVPQTEYLNCVLQYYEPVYVSNMIRLLFQNFPQNDISIENDDDFFKIMIWINQILAYSITEECCKKNSGGDYFQSSINMYINIIKRLGKINDREKANKYFEIIVIQLSKAFHHDLFLVLIENVMNSFHNYLFKDGQIRSHNLTSLVIQFCLGGAKKVKERKRDKYIDYFIKHAINLIAEKGFIQQNLFDLYKFKLQQFQCSNEYIISKFEQCYDTNTTLENLLNCSIYPEFAFFKMLIDECSSDAIKRNAFSVLIKNLKLQYFNLSAESPVVKKWPTKLIKQHFLHWFSSNPTIMINDSLSADIFELIYYGEKDGENTLETYAKNIIADAISTNRKVFLNSLPVIGDFLISHIDFIISLSHEFVKLITHIQSNTKVINWFIVCANVLLQLNAFTETERELILAKISSFDSELSDFSVQIAISSILFFCNSAELFFTSIQKILDLNADEKKTGDLSLVQFYFASFVYHSNDSRFKSGFTLDQNILKELNQTVLVSLILIANSTEIFYENPEVTNELLNYINEKLLDEQNEDFGLYGLLSTSITSNHDFLQENALQNYDQSQLIEHYITNRFIFSIIGKNDLIIHHALGSTVFRIENKSIIEKLPDLSTDPPLFEKNDPEKIEIEDQDPAIQEILEIYKSFQDKTDIKPYRLSPPMPAYSDVYSLLVDLGFFDYNSCKMIKRFEQQSDEINKLYISKFPITINCGILQIDQTGHYKYSNTALLSNLLNDLSNEKPGFFTTPLLRYEYLIPQGSNSPKKKVANASIVLLLNEDDSVIQTNSMTEDIMFLLSVKPVGEYYEIRIISKKQEFFTPFIKFDSKYLPWFIHKSCLSNFVSIMTLAHIMRNKEKSFVFIQELKSRADFIYFHYANTHVSSFMPSEFAQIRQE